MKEDTMAGTIRKKVAEGQEEKSESDKTTNSKPQKKKGMPQSILRSTSSKGSRSRVRLKTVKEREIA